MANENYKHNINGDYYFPMEIKDDADREYARAAGLAITRTRLGNRVIEAIMIPCKRVAYDSRGREVYLETPTEEQREIYLSYIRDELNEQDAMKRDGRCCIPDGGGNSLRANIRAPAAFPHHPCPGRLTSSKRL